GKRCSGPAVPVLNHIGGRHPLHSPAVGRILLAFSPQDVQERVLAHGRSHSTSTSERPEDRPLPVKTQANGRGRGLAPQGILEDSEFVQLPEPAAAKPTGSLRASWCPGPIAWWCPNGWSRRRSRCRRRSRSGGCTWPGS